ncbi:MAG: hypothetical protein WCR34_05745, partial [Bacilli bacterium]
YQWLTAVNANYGFAWLIDAAGVPSEPVDISISNLTGDDMTCYRPLSNDADQSLFELVDGTSYGLESTVANIFAYKYFWLVYVDEAAASAAEQTGYAYSAGTLATATGASVAGQLVTTTAQLDLHLQRARVAVGNALVLAVVSTNASNVAVSLNTAVVKVKEARECYRPLSNETDKSLFDIVNVAASGSVDPDDNAFSYQYYWLVFADSTQAMAAMQAGYRYSEGTLVTNAGDSVAERLVATGSELDLYQVRNRVAVGNALVLAVLALNDSGKASSVATTMLLVKQANVPGQPDSMLLAPLDFVSFTPLSPVPGNSLVVNLASTTPRTGTVHIEWYRNLTLYSSDQQLGGTAWTFTMPGRVTNDDGTSRDVTVKGDVWSFKAYYTENGMISRAIPPTAEYSRNMLFRVIGGTYDDDESVGSGTAAGARPPHPANVSITPSPADVNSILIAEVSAPGYEDYRDDDGHIFSFQYQWYVNGVAAAGETLPYFPAAGTALAADDRVSVAVFSMDLYGATSTTVMSNALQIQASIADGGVTAGATMAYENNSTKSMANRILPKAVESSLADANIQRHFFHEAGDVDWMWFLVPETMSNNKKRVLFETNTNSEMFNRYHQAELDFGADTQLVLYNQQGEQLHRNDDFGNPIGIGGTRYARFDQLLDPGIYFVQVSLANTKEYGSSVTAGTAYYVHLFIEEGSTSLGPTPPTTVTLSPASAAGTDNLVCTVAGSQSTSGFGVTYLYVWYRDGFVVPFGKTNATLETWNTQRFLTYNAMNYSSDANLSAAPHIVPAEFTGAGQNWYCDVYAMDEYGISDPVRSNEAIVASSEWLQAFRVDRSYLRNVGTPVTQLVTIGWADNATFGFDAAYDSAIPSMMVPGTDTPVNEPVSMGRFYSIGMHDTNIMMDRDIRPFGRGGSWFIKIEMGDSS